MKLTGSHSKYILFFLCLFIAGKRLFIDKQNSVLQWDTFGYYLYLPATFIYNDIGLEKKEDWLDPLLEKYKPSGTFYQAERLDNGKWFMRYSIGWSVLNFPFFYAGHLSAKLLGFHADGLSLPYTYAILFGALCYTFIGLVFLRWFLQYYFDDKIISYLLLLLVLGTNYLQLVTDGIALTHSYLFALYAIFFYYTYKWHRAHKLNYILAVSVVTGLIAITRPNEALIVLVFLLWNVFSISSAKIKARVFFKYYKQIIPAVLCGMAVVSLQLFYWKNVTDTWIFYSYRDPAVGFDFLTPHTSEFLFSFRKGWFVYTPLMVVCVAGLVFWYKKTRSNYLGLWIFLLLNIYIVSSWTCWWYAGGSYSSRSMMPSYVFLICGLGYVIQWLRNLPVLLKTTGMVLGILFCALNLFQYWQFTTGVLNPEYMTYAYYKSIFLKTKAPEGSEHLLLPERNTTEIDVLPGNVDFIQRGVYVLDSTLENATVVLDSSNQFSSGLAIAYNDLTKKNIVWLRVEANIFIPSEYDGPDPLVVAAFHYKDRPYKYRSSERITKIEKGKTNYIRIDYQSPEVRTINDIFKAYVWHRGKTKVYVQSLRVTAFEYP